MWLYKQVAKVSNMKKLKYYVLCEPLLFWTFSHTQFVADPLMLS